MRLYKERVVPSYTTRDLVSRKCDLCGKESNDTEWQATSCYEVNETEVCVTVRQKEGSSYPDGGSGTEYQIDLCPTCFKEKLVPWLRSQGADIKEEDWDW
jgi:hypothetical protein